MILIFPFLYGGWYHLPFVPIVIGNLSKFTKICKSERGKKKKKDFFVVLSIFRLSKKSQLFQIVKDEIFRE